MSPMHTRARRLGAGALLVVAIAVTGCTPAATLPPGASAVEAFGIRTAPVEPQACMDALLGGTLVRHVQSGLGVSSEGALTAVEWPFRYSARLVDGRVVLFDETGRAVAAEGDEITVGGGFGNQFWHACAPVNRVGS